MRNDLYNMVRGPLYQKLQSYCSIWPLLPILLGLQLNPKLAGPRDIGTRNNRQVYQPPQKSAWECRTGPVDVVDGQNHVMSEKISETRSSHLRDYTLNHSNTVICEILMVDDRQMCHHKIRCQSAEWLYPTCLMVKTLDWTGPTREF